MRARLVGVAKSYGAQVVLDDATLEVGPRARIGLVGPNGVGKSTVLRLLAGEEAPDRGVVSLESPRATVAHMPQEPSARHGETLRGLLRRLTGVAGAERELAAASAALAEGGASTHAASDRYDRALTAFLALGGGDLDARAAATCARLGLGVELDRPFTALSGGEAARASLAAVLLVRADLLLLDEPTNDLDGRGLRTLEGCLAGYTGALVVVSHDRAFLDTTVTRIAEIDPRSHAIVEWAGGWSDYARRRDEVRARAYAQLADAAARRRELTELLSRRRTEARAQGAGLGERSGGADRRGTNALRTKVRQTERLLERNPLPEKPYEPWALRLALRSTGRLPTPVATLAGAVVERGSFRLGPVDVELLPGERLALTGPNGAGKTTLLRALLGELELTAGTRYLGRGVVPGVIGQRPVAYDSLEPLVEAFGRRVGFLPEDARTLLAKFGLGASHVGRSCTSLSPGERTRAHLAELQAGDVNLLVLDEPTNHLDLEAVEQLEAALAGWDGALVVVSHDRRFVEAVRPTRELALSTGTRRGKGSRDRDSGRL
jgi:ATPase subunit of ABC transporter with duplicated ATPase domains